MHLKDLSLAYATAEISEVSFLEYRLTLKDLGDYVLSKNRCYILHVLHYISKSQHFKYMCCMFKTEIRDHFLELLDVVQVGGLGDAFII